MNHKSGLSFLLTKFSDAIKTLNDEDIEKILSGTHSIELKIVKNKSTSKSEEDSDQTDVLNITKNLDSLADRVIAGDFLRETVKTKKKLELVARKLDIAISKQDKTEDLIAKIVESTVGARLRSAAIRGSDV